MLQSIEIETLNIFNLWSHPNQWSQQVFFIINLEVRLSDFISSFGNILLNHKSPCLVSPWTTTPNSQHRLLSKYWEEVIKHQPVSLLFLQIYKDVHLHPQLINCWNGLVGFCVHELFGELTSPPSSQFFFTSCSRNVLKRLYNNSFIQQVFEWRKSTDTYETTVTGLSLVVTVSRDSVL